MLGKVAETRTKNDELIALSKRYPMIPIASVHPYEGDAAFVELERLAGLGVRAIKLHPHTQKFDAADERVLAVCRLTSARSNSASGIFCRWPPPRRD